MKKLLAVLLCALLIAGTASADINGMTAFLKGQKDPDMAVKAFEGPSDEFSGTAAWFLLKNFMQQDAQSAKAGAEAMGLTVVKQEHYDKTADDHSHTSAYTLSRGEMTVRGETRNVAVVTIRATSDGEWTSNFDFAYETQGDCVCAENFMAAARDIYAGIKDELDAMDAPVIMVTGYSRGAACANLLGYLIDADFDPADVYVYTFATPNTLREAPEGCGNIFNIVNKGDVVTNLPPAAWGFCRAGTDIELKSEGVNTGMLMMFMSLLSVCPDIDSYYNDRHSLTEPGLSEDGLTVREIFMGVGAMMDGVRSGAMIPEVGEESDYAKFIGQFAGLMDPGDGGIPGFFAQHMPAVYIQLMMGLE